MGSLLTLLLLFQLRGHALTCEERNQTRSQEARIFLVDKNILSPVSRYTSSNSCTKDQNPSAAEEGCKFIRNEAWRFTLPFGKLKDWEALQEKEGGRDKFYKKYGMIPSTDGGALPMGVTLAPNGKDLHFNCFLCHGGTVDGRPYEGAANTRMNVDHLFQNFNKNIFADGYLFALGSFRVPHHPEANLAAENAKLALDLRDTPTGNITVASIARYAKDQLVNKKSAPKIPNYAPPWWNAAPGLRTSAFISGQYSLGAGHMSVMGMLSGLSKEELKALNPAFQKVAACVQSVPVPKKVFVTEPALVDRGRKIYNGQQFKNPDCNCVKCHGKTEMDSPWDYPEKQVPLDKVKTDPEFNKSFDPNYRRRLAKFMKEIDPCSEFQDTDKEYVVAPPLVALFTKSGLLHNRSVPTLQDLLCVSEQNRPRRWKNKESVDVYDFNSVDRIPEDSPETYDTSRIGSKNTGHDFCTQELSKDATSCRDLIEYMKTLGP